MNRKEKITLSDLARAYAVLAALDPHGRACGEALQELARACAYSVLRKCIDVSGKTTKLLLDKRRDIAATGDALDRIAYAAEHEKRTEYNAEGDKVDIIDADLSDALAKLCDCTIGDGYDLVQDASIAILEETKKQRERVMYTLYDDGDNIIVSGYTWEGDVPIGDAANKQLDNGYFLEVIAGLDIADWMEKPYAYRDLKQRVVIKDADSVGGWQTYTTTPIQAVFIAVRRAIQHNGSIKIDPRNGYTYIEDKSSDPDSNLDAIIYRRYGKYADIGGYVRDVNGRDTFYTADAQTAVDMDNLVARLNLTARQAVVLDLLRRRKGYKAIGTYLGLRPDRVRQIAKDIQRKARAIGFVPRKDR